MPEHTVSPHHAAGGWLTVIEGVAAPLPLRPISTPTRSCPSSSCASSTSPAGPRPVPRYALRRARRAARGLRAEPAALSPGQRAGGRPTSAAARAASTRCVGLQQVAAVIASGFAREIFYSNAFNNRLLLVMLPQAESSSAAGAAVGRVAARAHRPGRPERVRAPGFAAGFTLAARQREMFRRGLDMIGLTLTQAEAIAAFARRHHAHSPWLYDVAAATMARLRPRRTAKGGTQGGDRCLKDSKRTVSWSDSRRRTASKASPSTRWSADRGRRFCCCTGIRRRM